MGIKRKLTYGRIHLRRTILNKFLLLQQELSLSRPGFSLDVSYTKWEFLLYNLLLFGYLILDHKTPDNCDFSYHQAYNDILTITE